MIPYTIAVSVQGMADNLKIKVNGALIDCISKKDVPTAIGADTACATIAASILGQYVPHYYLTRLFPAFKDLIVQKIGFDTTHGFRISVEFKINLQGFLHRHGCLFKPTDPIEEGFAGTSYRHANPTRQTAIFLDQVGKQFLLTVCKGIAEEDHEMQMTIDPYWEAIQIEGEDPVMRKLYDTLHRIYSK